MTTDSSGPNSSNQVGAHQNSADQNHADQNSADRIAAGRAVYARNLALTEVEAETLIIERAGTQFTTEAFLAAGGPGWSSRALTD